MEPNPSKESGGVFPQTAGGTASAGYAETAPKGIIRRPDRECRKNPGRRTGETAARPRDGFGEQTNYPQPRLPQVVCGGDIKANGFDIALVQRLLQHSSAAVTQRYIGMEPQRIEKAIEGHAKLI